MNSGPMVDGVESRINISPVNYKLMQEFGRALRVKY